LALTKESRQCDRGQNADDENYDEQLNERESTLIKTSISKTCHELLLL